MTTCKRVATGNTSMARNRVDSVVGCELRAVVSGGSGRHGCRDDRRMRRRIRVQSLSQYLQRMIDRRARTHPKQKASARCGAIRDLNPDVILVGVNAGHLQQPFVEADAHAPLIQRAEPAIHNLRLTTLTRPLSRHACCSSTTGASSARKRRDRLTRVDAIA